MSGVIENRGPQLLAVASTFVAAATLALVLRIYVRFWVVKSFGIDDWAMTFAGISFILFCASAITGIHYGTGRHVDDLQENDRVEAMKYWWLCYIWYCLTMISSKISIGMFLLRIAVERIHTWIIYLAMMLTVVTGLVFFFVTLLQCQPISYFWYQDQSGSCINVDVIIGLTYLYSAFSVISDSIFAILPIFIIQKLQVDKRTKVLLMPLLTMACIASAAVVVRFAYVHDFKNPDFLYATVDIAIWSTTEQGLAITAGSLATLRPLVKSLSQRLGLSSSGRAETPLSRQKLPRTGRSRVIGSRSAPDAFGLATLSTQDDKTLWTQSDLLVETGLRIESTAWDGNGHGVNESEENLRAHGKEGSSDGHSDAQTVVPQSFVLVKNGR